VVYLLNNLIKDVIKLLFIYPLYMKLK